MRQIIAFFSFFLLFQTAEAQNTKWVFKEKDGSKRVEILKNETIEVVWRSDEARSVSAISADFLGIQNDSIILENSAGTAFSRPLKEARSIKVTVPGGDDSFNKKGTGVGLILGGVLLWIIGFLIVLRIGISGANSPTGTTSTSGAQSAGCCLTSILGLAAIIVGIVFAASSGPRSHTEVIDLPAKNWTIKKVDIP